MKVDNNKYAGGKTVEEMQEQLDRCLAFEKRFGKTTRSTSWIKWCTSETYRKRSRDFNRSIISVMKNMHPYTLNKIINDPRHGYID
jgi:hypothetical protein